MNDLKIKNLNSKLLACVTFLLCLAAYCYFDIPCPVKQLLQIPCPGCGMTHAYGYLLQLQPAAAFRSHPMFWSVPILVAAYFTDGRFTGKKLLDQGILILIGAGFLIQWIVKLILT